MYATMCNELLLVRVMCLRDYHGPVLLPNARWGALLGKSSCPDGKLQQQCIYLAPRTPIGLLECSHGSPDPSSTVSGAVLEEVQCMRFIPL